MRRIIPVLSLAFILCAGPALADHRRAASPLAVTLDQTTRVMLRGAAASVVVGNPAIADVTMIDARNLFVMGRSHGVTNLVVLDALGRTIFDNTVVVSGEGPGRVSVQRGAMLNNYTCGAGCQRTPLPGEARGPYEDAAASGAAHRSAAKDASEVQ